MCIDIDHLKEHGWIRVDDVIPVDLLQPVVEAICNFWEVDLSDPTAIRRDREIFNGIVPIHQHQALWDTRQYPRLHDVFAAIYDTEALWVSMDRASYKPHISTRANVKPGTANVIHVDKKLSNSNFSVQGVLYLTDTSEDQAAWECVPEMFQEIRRGERSELGWGDDIGDYDLVKVPGKAGSMVIWDGCMPHSSGHNWTDTPRFAQYITMNKVGNEAERLSRIDNWRSNRAPDFWRDMPGQLDPEPWKSPALLTDLGEKLLGLKTW